MVFGPSYTEQPFEFFLLNITQKEAGIKMIRINGNITGQILSAYGWSDTEVCFIGNYSAGAPFMKIVDTIDSKDKILNLEYVEGGAGSEFFLNDVLNLDLERKCLTLNRSCKTGNYIDLYNFEKQKLYYSIKEENDDSNEGIVKMVYPPDNSYFIEYYSQGSIDESPEINFKVCWILNLKTSMMYLLESVGIIEQYGEVIGKDIISVLI